MKAEDRLAVITGASSGIGAATAVRLARAGLSVALVARRIERLEALAEQIRSEGGVAHVLPADLGAESDRIRVCEAIQALGGAEVLVNNAGQGWYGYCAEMPWPVAREMLKVNVEAVVQFSLNILEQMKAHNRGHIINVGSISGSLPSQGIALYGATKAFLDNFSTALHRELRGTPIHVSVVRAGPVTTEFCATAAQRANGLRLPTERMGVTSEAVANRILDLVRHPRRVIYIPRYLVVVPWLELSFGWLIDALGPLLLRWQKTGPKRR
jgi:uncharacterized protein